MLELYVRRLVCQCLHMHACMNTFVVCMFSTMYVFTYEGVKGTYVQRKACIYTYIHIYTIYVCVCIYMYMDYIYVCMYMYVFRIYMHTKTHIPSVCTHTYLPWACSIINKRLRIVPSLIWPSLYPLNVLNMKLRVCMNHTYSVCMYISA